MRSLFLPTQATAAVMPATARRQHWGRRVALVVVGGLIVLEALLRVLWGFGNPVLLMKDPEIGYLIQPNQNLRRLGHRVTINAYHQRSGPVTPLPAAGTTRILCLGDSVTFGTTLLDQSQTIPELLQSELRKSLAGPVEVLNASAGGWAPANELAYIKRFGTLGARLVVFQIGSHDLVQPKSLPEGLGVDPALPVRRPPSALGEVWQRYLRPRLAQSTVRAPTFPGRGPAAGPQCELNLRVLAEAFRVARAQGAQAVLLHTPNRDEVSGPARSDEYETWRRRLLALADQEGVPVLNLCELWKSDPAAGGYFHDEVHLTAAGTAAAAAAIARFLHARPLLALASPGPASHVAGATVLPAEAHR